MSDIAEQTATEEKTEFSSDDKAYQYFKEHPSALITSASAIVAVISFVINGFLFFNEYKYLQYWGFSITQIERNSTNQIYIFAIAFIFLVGVSIMQRFSAATFKVYLKQTAYVATVRKLHKCYRKEAKDLKKQLSDRKRRAKKIKKSSNDFSKAQKAIEAILRNERKTKEIIADIRDAAKSASHLKWLLTIQLIISIAPAVIIVAISMSFLFLIGEATWPPLMCVLVAIVYAAAITILGYLLSYLMEGQGIRRRLRDAKGNIDDIRKIYDEVKQQDLSYAEYPINTWPEYDLKDILSDSNIKSTLGLYAFYLFFFLVIFLFVTSSTQKDRTSFPLYVDDKAAYIVIYQNSSLFYMDKVEQFDNNSITINTSEHRIISSSDISYEVVTFDSVRIIEKAETSQLREKLSSMVWRIKTMMELK